MEHPEAAERIQAALVGSGKLGAIAIDLSPTGIELRRHLEVCSECRAELQAWQLVDQVLAAATPDDLAAPAEARGRILDAVVASGVVRGPAAPAPTTIDLAAQGERTVQSPAQPVSRPPGAAGSRPAGATHWRVGRYLLVAAAVVALFLAGARLGGPWGLAPLDQAPAVNLADALVFAANVLDDPGHVVAALRTPAGATGGAVALVPDSGELVAISGALTPPADGQRYVCYLERDGQRTEVGWMWFTGAAAYWTGAIAEPGDAGRPGDRFIVQLDGAPGPALVGTF
jgi:hypothetical protein